MLPDNEFNHFLKLFVAVRIVSCGIYSKYFPIASKLFKKYIEEYALIYGRQDVGSNVHNLCHIIEDMENCNVKNLMEISTYKFENALRMLKLNLKHSNRALEQAVCRTIEQNELTSNSQSNHIQSTKFEPKVSFSFYSEGQKLFKKIEFAPNIILSVRNSNNSWFMTKSKEIVKLEYVESNDGLSFKLYGKKIEKKEMFFESPINSMRLDIYECDIKFDDELKAYDLNCIEAKMMCLSYKNKIVLMPILHTLEILNK